MILHGYTTEKKDLLYENTNIIVRERSIMRYREDHFTVIEKSTYQEIQQSKILCTKSSKSMKQTYKTPRKNKQIYKYVWRV